ncbi:MAG: glycine cleavage system aminomethyltransferase GcvT, partial [Gammaproteobacteria bacterium]|nr:glycine cleavage system aminomethyltransferase GcvT [Gammaproteobacteria bacterium]
RRVGLQPQGRAPVREHSELTNDSGEGIGKVTSGGFSPSLSKPIAMGYVDAEYTPPGTEIAAIVRDKPLPMQVAKLPFVKQRYYRG